jgi:hypothetical protein
MFNFDAGATELPGGDGDTLDIQSVKRDVATTQSDPLGRPSRKL